MKTMTKSMILGVTAAAILAAGTPSASAGDCEWATAGKILTGVVAGTFLAHALAPAHCHTYSAPACSTPTVVYQTPTVVYQTPAVVYQTPVVVRPAPVVVYHSPGRGAAHAEDGGQGGLRGASSLPFVPPRTRLVANSHNRIRSAPGLPPGVLIVSLHRGRVLALSFAMDELRQRLDRFLGKTPVLGREVYLAPGAVVVGDVALGDNASVWFNAVLRGDLERIVVGHHTNVQDNAVLHLSNTLPCLVGNYVTIGHGALVHACTVGDETLIGMGATVLDGAVIGRQCMVGANALVTEGKQFPEGSLILGMPARVVRALSPEERAGLKEHAEKYAQVARYFLSLNHPAHARERPSQKKIQC